MLKAEIGNTTVYYTRGFELISRREGTVASYYIYDGGLSVRALTNEAGTVTDTLVTDSFGNETGRTGTTDNPYGFQGEEQDATGLYYLRARYMDPATGTFTTMDTYGGSLSDPMSLHKYLFANSNPVMYCDPSGHSASLSDMAATMAISSILAGACYSSCVIVAAILDASTGSNRLSKYSFTGLINSMLIGFVMGGIAWEFGIFFAALGLTCLQYFLISIICLVVGVGFKYCGDKLKQSDKLLIGSIVSTIGDVGLVAAFSAASTGLLAGRTGNSDDSRCEIDPESNTETGVTDNNGESLTKVGRWMSREEYYKMLRTGKVQQAFENRQGTHVSSPANIDSFKNPSNNSLYVEFYVDSSRVIAGGRSDWGIVTAPGSYYDILNQSRGGAPYTDMPYAYNIVAYEGG